MKTRNTIAVVGAGAIGTLFAAAAHKAGQDVLLCARRSPQHTSIVVETPTEIERLPIPVLVDATKATPVDWVFLATKAHDVPSTAVWLDGFVGPDTTVVVLQNGMDHIARVRPLLPHGTEILPGIIYITAELVEPGHVVTQFGDRITVPDNPAAERFATLLADSPLQVGKESDFDTAAWRKFLLNLITNPITALTMRRMAVFDNPDVRALAQAMLSEAVAVGRAAGAALSDVDVREAMDMASALSPQDGTSMLYDRLADRHTEHELISGALVRIADEKGIAVPLNRAVLALMRGLGKD